MADFPTMPRMPGSDDSFAADEFEPGELAGMRLGGALLLGTAGLILAGWTMGRANLALPMLIDIFLGVQLLRLRHSWRAWVLLRAWLGLPLGLLIALGGLAGAGWAGILLGYGHMAYSGALLLLLFGRPTPSRVFAAKVIGAVAMVLIVGAMLVPRTSVSEEATIGKVAIVAADSSYNRAMTSLDKCLTSS